MGASITHAAASGAGHGAGGLIDGVNWDAAHTVAGLYSRQQRWALLGGTGSFSIAAGTFVGTDGGGNSASTTGTLGANAGSGNASRTTFTTAATTSATGSVTAALGAYIPPLNTKRSVGVSVTAQLDFPDASYGTGSTGARIVFGAGRTMSDMLAADNGTAGTNTAQGIWFSYSGNRGPNWFLVIYSASGSISTVDTGVAFTPGTWSFTLDFSETTASFIWTLRNIGGSSASGTVLNSANPFPVNLATTYIVGAGIMTLSAVARVMALSRMGIDLLEPA